MPDLEKLRELLDSDWVREPTRRVMQSRLDRPVSTELVHFSGDAFRALTAICSRLIPQDPHEVDLPGELDAALQSGPGKGWRYDALPPDDLLFETGICAVDSEARLRFGIPFCDLAAPAQDEILRMVQHGETSAPEWERLPASLFFTELLTALVTIYYSHPAGRMHCGDRSFADAHGWSALGLDAASDLPD